MDMSKERTAPRLCRVQGLSFIQKARVRDVFDLTSTLDELLFPPPNFQIHLWLQLRKKPHLLEIWVSWWPVNLNCGPASCHSHAPCSAAWCGWTWWLSQCGPWPLCWAFQSLLSPVWWAYSQHVSHEMSTGKVWLQRSLGATKAVTLLRAAVYSNSRAQFVFYRNKEHNIL